MVSRNRESPTLQYTHFERKCFYWLWISEISNIEVRWPRVETQYVNWVFSHWLTLTSQYSNHEQMHQVPSSPPCQCSVLHDIHQWSHTQRLGSSQASQSPQSSVRILKTYHLYLHRQPPPSPDDYRTRGSGGGSVPRQGRWRLESDGLEDWNIFRRSSWLSWSLELRTRRPHVRVLAEVLERLGNWPAMSTMSMNIFSSSRPILSVQALTQLPLVPGLQGGLDQLDEEHHRDVWQESQPASSVGEEIQKVK